MSEGATHCPYIGLKQNRAIRFSTPTAEHRCYINGEATEVPVDQASYCLSPFHTQCPLYMGSLGAQNRRDDVQSVAQSRAKAEVGTRVPASPAATPPERSSQRPSGTPKPAPAKPIAPPVRPARVAADDDGFDGGDDDYMAGRRPAGYKRPASARPSAAIQTGIPQWLYGVVVGVLLVAVVVFVFADQLLQGGSVAEVPAEASPVATTAAEAFEPLPTASTPQATAVPVAIVSEPTATEAAQQANAQAPTATFPPRPTARTVPTFTPSPVSAGGQATATAGVATVVTTATVATSADGAAVATPLWLYFADASGTMYVPVYRSVPVVAKRVAGASLTALIDGPRSGMTQLILPETQLKSLVVRDGVAEVDFDRAPTAAGDIRGYVSIVHTLTQFGTVKRVKFFINGVEVPATGGIPSERIRINEWNPDDLSIDEAIVLPLYFVSPDGRFDIPVSKLVPKTDQVAAATVNGLIKGAGVYADKVKQTIPSDTQVRSVTLQNGVAVVDVSTAFTAASDRAGAMRTLVESLTSWPAITGVKVTVEGQSIAGAWGAEWDRVFERRTVNPE